MSIQERLQALHKELLPTSTKLIAVSKYHTQAEILEAYNAGQRLFGENRVQELLPKAEALPKDIEWHLIGTLQRNKVKYVAPFVTMIHSIDSQKLLLEVEKQCQRLQRDTLPILLQIDISHEDTKHGFTENELQTLLDSQVIESLHHTQIAGLMGMAALTEDMEVVLQQFQHLQALFQKLKSTAFANNPHFTELSMGMTNDYRLAVQCGATFVRIGSGVFS